MDDTEKKAMTIGVHTPIAASAFNPKEGSVCFQTNSPLSIPSQELEPSHPLNGLPR